MAHVDRDYRGPRAVAALLISAALEWRAVMSPRLLHLASLGVLLVLSALSVCEAADITLITHPGVSIESLTQNEARLYMTMRLNQWPDGRRTQVFVLPDNDPLHEAVAKEILGLYPYQLRRVWDRQLFSGTGPAPITVATEAQMIERVAKTPGALGYAESRRLDASVHKLEVR